MMMLDHAAVMLAEQVTARGAHGVVCAAAPQAAQAGAAALREGGNAFDAVLAAALAETVLLPPKCGFGGDLVALVIDPQQGPTPMSLVAVGGAAAGLARRISDGAEFSTTGPDSVGPPSAAVGYAALAERAELPLERLAAPAIDLARHGFAWAAVCTRLQRMSADLVRRWNPAGTAYFPEGRPFEPGELVRLPGLADVLDEFVLRGGDLLAGPVGAAILDTVARHGGVLTAADFEHARAEWVPCAVGTTAGRTIWTTPAPTHGPALIDAVADAVGGDAPGRQYERVMRAVAAARDTLSDPGGTSMVSAVDADGRVAVVVHSNSFPQFGSGLVVEDFHLVLANRAGRGFTPVVGHPNFPIAGRRPATTLHAWAISDTNGRPEFAGATPGGANQMPWNAQLVQGIIDGERSPGRLVTAPRWEWLPADDGVRVEAALADVDSLRSVAPRVVETDRWAFASAQQVVAVPSARRSPARALEGATDPRTVGLALGV